MKKGLDYFSIPCMEDETVELIEAEFGIEGFAVMVKLLSKIYGQNGYYCQWDTDCAMLFARKNCIDFNFANKVVEVAIRRGFFSRRMYECYGILTSDEIQQFYLNAAKRRKEALIDSRFVCTDLDTDSVKSAEPILPSKEETEEMAVTAVSDIAEDDVTYYREDAFFGITEPEEPYVVTVSSDSGESDVIVYPSIDECASSEVCEGEEENNDVKKEKNACTGEEKKAFGRYGNVLLTEGERAELGRMIRDADDYIDRFSQKLHDRGYRYANHYGALLEWWKRDSGLPEACGGIGGNGGNGGKGESLVTFNTDEFFAAAVKKSAERRVDTV